MTDEDAMVGGFVDSASNPDPVGRAQEAVARRHLALKAAMASLQRAQAGFCADAFDRWRDLLQCLSGDAPNLRVAAADWSDDVWSDNDLSVEDPVPSAVRIGDLTGPGDSPAGLPAFVPLIASSHIMIRGSSREKQLDLLQNILLRAVLTAPPGAIRLALTDPVGGGASTAALLALPSEVRRDPIATQPIDVESLLGGLVRDIEQTVQTRLLDSSPDLAHYNRHHPETPAPFQLLAMPDLGVGLSERAREALRFIADQGARAGVHIVATSALDLDPKEADHSAKVTRSWTLVEISADGTATWTDSEFGALHARVNALPDPARARELSRKVASALKQIDTKTPFARVAVPAERWWTGDSTHGFAVPIGVDTSGEIQEFALGAGNFHALIGGMTGYGKSKLLDLLITQLASEYSPDEIGFYLVDLKEGLAFQDYARLPHARVVALENDREFGLNILKSLQDEIPARSKLFKDTGLGTEDITQFRATRSRMARLILIVDEFQLLFAADDHLARQSGSILEDLVKRGRAYGIHVLLCSQSPRVPNLYHDQILGQVGLRVAFRCDERVSQSILGEGNTKATELEQPGEAICNASLGSKASDRRFRVALLGPGERQALVGELIDRAAGRYPAPVRFTSSERATFARNEQLQAEIDRRGWTPSLRSVALWLGEPIEIKAPTAAEVGRAEGANLLIAGGREEEGVGILASAVVSLSAQIDPSELRVDIVDFVGASSVLAGRLKEFERALVHRVTVSTGRDSRSVLPDLVANLEERIAAGAAPQVRTFLVIAGLQRWRELRPPEAYVKSEAAEFLARLLDEGPEVGIHVLAWVDSLENVERALGRASLRSFDLRVGLHLGESESNTFLGAPTAARMQDHRALFRCEEWPTGVSEKFKPYPFPDERVLEGLHKRLLLKAGQDS